MISGHTQLCFLLADPVEHVRTPQMFNAHLEASNVDAVVVPLNVPRDDLARVIAGVAGCLEPARDHRHDPAQDRDHGPV